MENTIRSRLSAAEKARYQANGYVIPEQFVLPEDEFQALRAHFQERLAAWPVEQRPEAMDTPHFADPALLRWALHPAVIDLVEPLLGPDIFLFSTHFICKPAGHGRRVPGHEDSAYWRGKLEPMHVVTLWLALDPSIRANGCMQVIPGSHKRGARGFSEYGPVDFERNVFPTEILRSGEFVHLAQAVELQPNQCSLHDARLIHGSDPNTSEIRRCGWTLRFCPADVHLAQELRPVHPIYQARGRNLLQQPMADPNRVYDLAAARAKAGIKGH